MNEHLPLHHDSMRQRVWQAVTACLSYAECGEKAEQSWGMVSVLLGTSMTMDVFPDNGTRGASSLKTSQDGSKAAANLEPEPLTPAAKDQCRDFRSQTADDTSPVTPSSSRLAKAMASRKAFIEELVRTIVAPSGRRPFLMYVYNSFWLQRGWNGGTDLDKVRIMVIHKNIDLYELFKQVVNSGGPGALIDQRVSAGEQTLLYPSTEFDDGSEFGDRFSRPGHD